MTPEVEARCVELNGRQLAALGYIEPDAVTLAKRRDRLPTRSPATAR